ncbi:MAG: MBL fold metallo-hydrolase [Spirochaetia bacterium]|nr:MBL fold metallo-hydrolase [Spirochaetia bacterium]
MKVQKSSGSFKQIEKDIYQITLPQPFYLDNHIYLILDEKPLLIDSGYIESGIYLAKVLKDIGISLNKIKYIFYTHPHIDHISGGMLLRGYVDHIKTLGHYLLSTDIPNYMNYVHDWYKETARFLKISCKTKSESEKKINDFKMDWNSYLTNLQKQNPRKRPDEIIYIDIPLKENDIISTGKYNFKVIETPGHSKWHLSLAEENYKWFFSGDLIIGNIPAIYHNWDGNFNLFRNTLDKVLQYSNYNFFPAHGNAINNPKKEIRIVQKSLAIIEKSILRSLSIKPKNLREVSELLFSGKPENKEDNWFIALALIESILKSLTAKKLAKEIKNKYQLY